VVIDMTTFKQAYEEELMLIRANGGNKDALQFRFAQLKQQRDDLLEYITRRTIEHAGREKALKEYVRKLQEEST